MQLSADANVARTARFLFPDGAKKPSGLRCGDKELGGMMKLAWKTFPAVFLVTFLAQALAMRASGPKTETVHFSAGKETVDGFLATPEKPGHYPAVVVIHDWLGLNDWVKEQTEKLAEQGFVALAVDLFHGAVATNTADAGELSRGLPDDVAVADLTGAFDYLAARTDVDRVHIGAIGWSMGGGLAIKLATHQPRLAACVVNYGTLPTDPNDIGSIWTPLLGNFGANDRGVTPDDVHSFEKALKALGRRVDIKIYDGAGHGFENPVNTTAYNAQAAADAWTRTIDFLNKRLR